MKRGILPPLEFAVYEHFVARQNFPVFTSLNCVSPEALAKFFREQTGPKTQSVYFLAIYLIYLLNQYTSEGWWSFK